MRWIFLTLVAANLLMFSYYWSQQQPSPQPTAFAPENYDRSVKSIELIDDAPPLVSANKNGNSERYCMLFGPMPESFAVKSVLARLKALNLTGRERSISLEGTDEFWVYLAPMANRKQAMRKLKELQRKKIDSYIITQGELNNGISLGLFTNRGAAESTRSEVRKKGYGALIKPLKREKKERWIEVAVGSFEELTPRIKEKIQGNYTKQRWEESKCQ